MRRIPVPVLLVLIMACLVVSSASLQAQDKGEVEKLYQAAVKAEAARDYLVALATYEKLVELDAEHRDAMDRWEACQDLAVWQKTLQGTPTAADLVRLGEVLARCKRFEEERKVYREAIALDPKLADAHGHLAMSNYTSRGGSMMVVVEETSRLLQASPNRAQLEQVIADWNTFGKLRVMQQVLADELKVAAAASKAGDTAKAAAILEETAAKQGDTPDAYRTTLLAQAGELRLGAGDKEGARKAFEAAIRHTACRSTINARLGLAALDTERGDSASALEHLRAAVAEGNWACRVIESRRNQAFRPLFESEDAAVREEMAKLADPRVGDEPIRAMIRAACARAGKEGKKVLLEWYGPYCPFVMLLEERLADPRIRKILDQKFVFIRMNQGGMQRGSTLDEEYGKVMRTYGVPCFFVLDPDGSVDSTQRDAPLMSAPNRAFSVEKIAAWLEDVAG